MIVVKNDRCQKFKSKIIGYTVHYIHVHVQSCIDSIFPQIPSELQRAVLYSAVRKHHITSRRACKPIKLAAMHSTCTWETLKVVVPCQLYTCIINYCIHAWTIHRCNEVEQQESSSVAINRLILVLQELAWFAWKWFMDDIKGKRKFISIANVKPL